MAQLWGGRFNKKTNMLVAQFTKSIGYDCTLAKYDCIGSLVHIDTLKKAGLLTATEHKKLRAGLTAILKKVEAGSLKIDGSMEDIHSYIQTLLEKDSKVGAVALKLQTCRSRNDQVAFATKLYCLDNIAITNKLIAAACASLGKLAKKNKSVCLPGYTHLQHAMPVRLSDHLSAYQHMLNADLVRLEAIGKNIQLVIGAGALAGTGIDAKKYSNAVPSLISKKKLAVTATSNAMHTVSDRDFVIESLSALSIVAMHLSRLAEDFILWSTKEFDFIDIDEAFCTGSSLMPQKKNPDVLELIRGYSGKLYGNLISVLVMMKGLPLSYNRDMQLDKEPLFESFEIVQTELAVVAQLLPAVQFKKETIAAQLADESLYATDIADLLVKKEVPFKTAHTIVGKLMQHTAMANQRMSAMSDAQLKKYHLSLSAAAIKKILNPKASVNAKKSIRKTVKK